jgi:hypothetical protein
MIAVIANPAEHAVAREFFELFKTPWEFYRSGRRYDVVLCVGDIKFCGSAKLMVVYAGEKIEFDAEKKIQIRSRKNDGRILCCRGDRIPIYGSCVTFRDHGFSVLTDEDSKQPAMHLEQSRDCVIARIGYNLFHEIRTLLTVGQPVANASLPTLELHIALLRNLILGSGIPLVEVPPVPDGYRFIACLTHDVDHPCLRQHMWDHTMFGFLYRAVVSSLQKVLRRRISVRDLLTNWMAACKLPFVHLGLAKDFWNEFDRYPALEKHSASTFFVIPFKEYPGRRGRGLAPRRRASRYAASDIASKLEGLVSSGCEIGLHGIDAWMDSARARAELGEIRRVTGNSDIGVRMHWLYGDLQTPLVLERAGASYDSSIGYNETIGYRSGTTQAYKPLNTARLLELPLHVMDTALFFPDHLNSSPEEARNEVDRMIGKAARFGGCLTVNWHDRSIAPERLWGTFYVNLVDRLENNGAWFSTASQAVSWFRKRRSVLFETVSRETPVLLVKVAGVTTEELPGLRLRIYKAREVPQIASNQGVTSQQSADAYVDLTLDSVLAVPPQDWSSQEVQDKPSLRQ